MLTLACRLPDSDGVEDVAAVGGHGLTGWHVSHVQRRPRRL
jgi:hypothetical protein